MKFTAFSTLDQTRVYLYPCGDNSLEVAVGRKGAYLSADDANRLTDFLISHGFGTKAPKAVASKAPISMLIEAEDAHHREAEDAHRRIDELSRAMDRRYVDINERMRILAEGIHAVGLDAEDHKARLLAASKGLLGA